MRKFLFICSLSALSIAAFAEDGKITDQNFSRRAIAVLQIQRNAALDQQMISETKLKELESRCSPAPKK